MHALSPYGLDKPLMSPDSQMPMHVWYTHVHVVVVKYNFLSLDASYKDSLGMTLGSHSGVYLTC